jgi:hypothetical protein
MIDRDNAVQSARTARTALAAILVTAPAPLREQLRPLPRERRARECAALTCPPGAPAGSAARQPPACCRAPPRSRYLAAARPAPPQPPRRLNRAIHVIAVNRMRCHPPTLAYVQRRRAEGKTDKEIRRCPKHYLARHLYRTLSRA